MSAHIPILLTASVSTRGMVGADFSAEAREAMYVATLRFYLQMLPREQTIIFAENSGWELGRLQAKIGADAARVTWVKVDPALSDQSRGKGYNEIVLINEVLRQLPEIRAFVKVTGRYPVYNLPFFLSRAQVWIGKRGFAYYGDMKDHRIFDLLKTGWNGHAAYTVLFATTTEFYSRVLAPTLASCNDATDDLIENVWYRALIPYRARKSTADRVILRFGREPVTGGEQGSNLAAKSFCKRNDSVRAKCQRAVGNIIRWFLPFLWF